MKDGGPAFPHDSIHQNPGGFPEPADGMSLRDWFAGRAMAGFLANPQWSNAIGKTSQEAGIPAQNGVAAMAYAQANAMLAERERAKEG